MHLVQQASVAATLCARGVTPATGARVRRHHYRPVAGGGGRGPGASPPPPVGGGAASTATGTSSAAYQRRAQFKQALAAGPASVGRGVGATISCGG